MIKLLTISALYQIRDEKKRALYLIREWERSIFNIKLITGSMGVLWVIWVFQKAI